MIHTHENTGVPDPKEVAALLKEPKEKLPNARGGKCTVTLPGKALFKKAYPCNLRGEVLDKQGIEISNQSFSFEISANQPRTFLLK